MWNVGNETGFSCCKQEKGFSHYLESFFVQFHMIVNKHYFLHLLSLVCSASLSLSCYAFRKNANNTNFALLFLLSQNQSSNPCYTRKEETYFPNEFFIADFYDPGFAGFGTKAIPFSLGPDAPSSIFYSEQKHMFTLDSSFGFALFHIFYGNSGLFVNRDVPIIATGVTSALPRATNDLEYLQVAVTPSLSLQQNRTYSYEIVAPETIPIQTKLVQSCKGNGEEETFSPSILNSEFSGLSTNWRTKKKLKINLIFLLGAYPEASTSAIKPAIDRMREVFGQKTVQVDLDFLVTRNNSPEFSMISEIETENEFIYGSLPSLYVNSANNQNPDALNIFIASSYDPLNFSAGLLGISSGIPGLPGYVGTKSSGMVVFIETHRSSGSAGSRLSDADLRFLGNTMAHEAGHFLGLFHLNESAGGDLMDPSSRDPMVDTPYCDALFANTGGFSASAVEIIECLGPSFTQSGARNLMFWQGDGVTDQSQLTGEQGWLIRKHPLVY